MNIDLSIFNISDDTSGSSTVLSPRSAHSSRSSPPVEGDNSLLLDIPSLDTPGGFGGFDLPQNAGTSSARGVSKYDNPPMFEESAIDNDPEFELEEDGSLRVVTDEELRLRSEIRSTAAVGNKAGSESGITDRVAAEHEAGLRYDQVCHNGLGVGLFLNPVTDRTTTCNSAMVERCLVTMILVSLLRVPSLLDCQETTISISNKQTSTRNEQPLCLTQNIQPRQHQHLSDACEL